MADDVYYGQTAIYGGRFNLPTWVQNQAINTWGTVPTSNQLADINPRYNPLLNPVYPSKPAWEGQGSFATITGYGGATYNKELHEVRLPLVVGHDDYAGGESYNIYLKSESPTWVMMHPPSGALPDAIVTNDGQENTGLYSNGRPRAVHTYNRCIWVPEYGHMVLPQGNCSHGANGGTLRAILFNQQTGLMDLFGASLGVGSPGDFSGAGTCWDESRQCVWVRGAGTGRFHRYYPATNTWQANIGSSLAVTGNVALVYIAEYDCIMWLCNTFNTAGGVGVFDCSTGVTTSKSVSGVVVGTNLRGLSQPRQISENTFAFWNNDTNTTIINTLSFDDHPITGAWSVSQLPVTEENSVIPTVATVVGTHGRFFHDSEFGILGLINAVNQPIYFYRYK